MEPANLSNLMENYYISEIMNLNKNFFTSSPSHLSESTNASFISSTPKYEEIASDANNKKELFYHFSSLLLRAQKEKTLKKILTHDISNEKLCMLFKNFYLNISLSPSSLLDFNRDLAEKLEFDGKITLFRVSGALVKIIPRQLALIEMQYLSKNIYEGMLNLLGFKDQADERYLIFEDRPIYRIQECLVKLSIPQKFELITKITQIFLICLAKGNHLCPTLNSFCLDSENNPVLIQVIPKTESFSSPPESVSNGIVNHHSSAWSLGMIIVKILFGKNPYIEESDKGKWKLLRNDKTRSNQIKQEYINSVYSKKLDISKFEDFISENKSIDYLQEIITNIISMINPLMKKRPSIYSLFTLLNLK